jgi:hypothetical protein
VIPDFPVLVFTNAELDRITELMLGRYRAMSASDVFRSPDPVRNRRDNTRIGKKKAGNLHVASEVPEMARQAPL